MRRGEGMSRAWPVSDTLRGKESSHQSQSRESMRPRPRGRPRSISTNTTARGASLSPMIYYRPIRRRGSCCFIAPRSGTTALYLLIYYLCSRPPAREQTNANPHVTVKTNHPHDQGTGAEAIFVPVPTKKELWSATYINGGGKIRLTIHYIHNFISQMNVVS